MTEIVLSNGFRNNLFAQFLGWNFFRKWKLRGGPYRKVFGPSHLNKPWQNDSMNKKMRLAHIFQMDGEETLYNSIL